MTIAIARKRRACGEDLQSRAICSIERIERGHTPYMLDTT